MDLCRECAEGLKQVLTVGGHFDGGARPLGANVDYKPRAAYVAASGATFTAGEARTWLIERGLANSKGRLSKDQLKAYADEH